jgi:hypothetical protein
MLPKAVRQFRRQPALLQRREESATTVLEWPRIHCREALCKPALLGYIRAQIEHIRAWLVAYNLATPADKFELLADILATVENMSKVMTGLRSKTDKWL